MTATSGAAKPSARSSRTGMAQRAPSESRGERHRLSPARRWRRRRPSRAAPAGRGRRPRPRWRELLDDEHLVADAHLVLHARAERVFVVEPCRRSRCRPRPGSRRSAGTPAGSRDSPAQPRRASAPGSWPGTSTPSKLPSPSAHDGDHVDVAHELGDEPVGRAVVDVLRRADLDQPAARASRRSGRSSPSPPRGCG